MPDDLARTEKLLALLLVNQMKESKPLDKIKMLKTAGFTNVEIADLLQTTAQVITNYLYTSRKAKKKKKVSKKTKKK